MDAISFKKETEKTMPQSHLALFQPIHTHKLNSWIYIFNHRPQQFLTLMDAISFKKETEKTMPQSHLALFQPIHTHKLNSWIYIFNHRPTCHFTWELT